MWGNRQQASRAFFFFEFESLPRRTIGAQGSEPRGSCDISLSQKQHILRWKMVQGLLRLRNQAAWWVGVFWLEGSALARCLEFCMRLLGNATPTTTTLLTVGAGAMVLAMALVAKE